MKKILTVLMLFLALGATTMYAQDSENATLLGHFPYDEGLSDIWGYEANNREFALVGAENGISIVDITDPTSLYEVDYIDASYSFWRDIKTWGNYAYAVDDQGGDGLFIINLSQLPESITYIQWNEDGLTTVHNIFIDENGYAYLFGLSASNGTDRTMILNLNDTPENPEIVGYYTDAYVHDGFVRGDTMWTSEIYLGRLAALDVSDKANPVLLGSAVTPSAFTHNCWLSDNGKYIFTTDEVSNGFIGAFNVSDVTDMKEVDRVQSNPGSNVIPHNTFVLDNYLVTSYYKDGITFHDATYPENIVQIGYFDTSPLAGDGFSGAWGVYPYFTSGKIIASDIEEGLFVISPNLYQACYLNGVVIDANSGSPVPNAIVTIVGQDVSTTTDLSGSYLTGIFESMAYDIMVIAPGYETMTIEGVYLFNGVDITQDVELTPLPSFTLTGKVVEDDTNSPIPNAHIKIVNEFFDFTINANEVGEFELSTFFDGNYDVIVGQWGHRTTYVEAADLNADDNYLYIKLDKGYDDYFVFDFGWDVVSDAMPTGGEFVREEPLGSDFGFGFLNPAYDVSGDIGEQCFVTGNTEAFDFVNSGSTTITSPMFDLTEYGEAHLSYYTWFTNIGQYGPASNDSLTIFISNGTETVVLEVVDTYVFGESNWVYSTFKVDEHIAITNTMQLSVKATADYNYSELLECAFDAFEVTDATGIVGVNDNVGGTNNSSELAVLPNPMTEQAVVSLAKIGDNTPKYFILYDVLGKVVLQKKVNNTENLLIERNDLPNGVYFYSLEAEGEVLYNGKLIMQ